MKAFKTYESCPLDQRPPSIPLDWVWSHLDITPDKQSDFESAGFIVLSDENFISYIAEKQQAYDDWANSFDVIGKQEQLRIYSHVQREFAKFHPSKIDFRRHLLPNIYFQKDVTFLPNGRPQKALYYYEGILIAEIEFTFEVNQFNFMTRRIEKLSYYKGSGEKSEQWLIADDIYDFANPYHLGEIMKERSEARSRIFEEIKAFLNGVFAAYYIPQGKTYPEILVIAGNLWNKYSNDIDSWVNVGSPRISINIASDTEFPFLDVAVTGTTTVRDWILDKVSY